MAIRPRLCKHSRTSRQPGSRRQPRCNRLGIESLEDRRVLATFMVTNLDDAGTGSLREAIADANTQAGADEIVFQAGLAGAIHLASGELSIGDELSIIGPDDGSITVDAGGLSRVVNVGGGASTELRNLTVRGGAAMSEVASFHFRSYRSSTWG